MAKKGVRLAQVKRCRRKVVNVAFPTLCRAVGLPEPVPEHRFDPERRWRFDWAWLEAGVALEREGAVWVNGRHTRGSGFIKDMEKYNRAAVLGWKVIRATPQQIDSGEILDTVKAAIGGSRGL